MIEGKNIKEDFDEFFKLLKESFPEIERRNYEGQKKILENNLYNVLYYKEGKEVVAFIAFWKFEDFIFIEHLAVAERLRSKGIGKRILNTLLTIYHKKVILEVEPVEDQLTKRRVEFYNRLGFKLNDYEYKQPPLQEGNEYLKLEIMSYPEKISKEEFLEFQDKVINNVYSII